MSTHPNLTFRHLISQSYTLIKTYPRFLAYIAFTAAIMVIIPTNWYSIVQIFQLNQMDEMTSNAFRFLNIIITVFVVVILHASMEWGMLGALQKRTPTFEVILRLFEDYRIFLHLMVANTLMIIAAMVIPSLIIRILREPQFIPYQIPMLYIMALSILVFSILKAYLCFTNLLILDKKIPSIDALVESTQQPFHIIAKITGIYIITYLPMRLIPYFIYPALFNIVGNSQVAFALGRIPFTVLFYTLQLLIMTTVIAVAYHALNPRSEEKSITA